MNQMMDALLESLLVKTNQLAHFVEDQTSDPNVWDLVLNEREEIIKNVTSLLQNGWFLSNSHKQQLELMQEINLRILPQMEFRREDVKKKLGSIQRKKMAKQYYNNGGPNGYGAFFDKKK